jgi:hypothetical protein
MTKLIDLASTIRSKNAGVNQITFDIIFSDSDKYQRVLKSKAITKESVAKLFRIPLSRISDFVTFSPANANQVHALPAAAERQPGRLGHPRLPAVRSAARSGNSGLRRRRAYREFHAARLSGAVAGVAGCRPRRRVQYAFCARN